jgi:phospholipid/cholesterol/gamma-HCH transport system permease protein
MIKSIIFKKISIGAISIVGKIALSNAKSIGRFAIFVKNIISSSLSKQFFYKNFLSKIFVNGFCSIPVVTITGLFTGGVLSVQLYYSLAKFGVTDTIPNIVLVAMLKELGPVLCGLMLVARVGSSMVAEIGGMAINNQIDSLITLSVNPFRFLYIPRILASIISMPMLTILASLMGVIGSMLVCTISFSFSINHYIQLLISAFDFYDFKIGVTKSVVFGAIISIVSCYKGSITEDGSVGIGRSTISAVVSCSIYILLFNFLITWLMSK